MLSGAVGSNVRLGELTYWVYVMHDLQEWVSVRVKNVGFQAAELRLIVESTGSTTSVSLCGETTATIPEVEIFYTEFRQQRPYPKSKSSTPNFEYSISTLRKSRGMAPLYSQVGVSGSF